MSDKGTEPETEDEFDQFFLKDLGVNDVDTVLSGMVNLSKFIGTFYQQNIKETIPENLNYLLCIELAKRLFNSIGGTQE